MTSKPSASALRAIERRANHKLAILHHVEEVSGSVAASCRYYGISRQAYYRWLKRYEAEGFEGLKDRSSAPHRSPTATEAEVVEKILWLRQQYHARSGEDHHVSEAVSLSSPSAPPASGGS